MLSLHGVWVGSLVREIISSRLRGVAKKFFFLFVWGYKEGPGPVGHHSDNIKKRFLDVGSKITAEGDCSHEIKRRLLLGGKVMTNLDSIFKSRDITLATKVRLIKAVVFPVVMYGCESWTIKKAEC